VRLRTPRPGSTNDSPRPLYRPPGPLGGGLERVARATEQPDVPAIQRRAAVLQLNTVIDVHSSFDTTAPRCLAAAACFTTYSISQRYPFRRGVELVGRLCRCRCRLHVGQTHARLQRAQLVRHDATATHHRLHIDPINPASAPRCPSPRCLTHSYSTCHTPLEISRVRSTRYRQDHFSGRCR
jgi:hypothetical protein